MLRDKAGGSFRQIASLTATHHPLLSATRRGEVLVPHSAGLAICTSYGCENYGVESGLQNTELLTVDEDREGSLWIGYSGHGLARWLGREEWQNFSELEGLSGFADLAHCARPPRRSMGGERTAVSFTVRGRLVRGRLVRGRLVR